MKMARTDLHDHILSSNSSDKVCFENNNNNDEVFKETKALVSELCRNFYSLGWVSGTGGSVSIKVAIHQENVVNNPHHQLFIMSPSGVQKERMVSEDMFVVCSHGFVLFRPLPKPYPHHINPTKCTDSAVLFLKIYEMRNAGAVIHSHAMESCIVTMINPFSKEFHMTNMEMIKWIQGHSYNDKLVVPIIENASHETDLLDSLTEAIIAYPKSNAILVRNHGVFIWGDTWITAKTQRFILLDIMAAAICSSRIPVKNGALYKDAGSLDMAGYVVSDDIPQALKTWHSSGTKVYVCSSNHSRVIQSQFFAKSNYGDLRKFICGFFHTTTMGTYKTGIPETVGVEMPSDLLFVTESLTEAMVARAAYMEAVILIRPGIDPSGHHGHLGMIRTIRSLLDLRFC